MILFKCISGSPTVYIATNNTVIRYIYETVNQYLCIYVVTYLRFYV